MCVELIGAEKEETIFALGSRDRDVAQIGCNLENMDCLLVAIHTP